MKDKENDNKEDDQEGVMVKQMIKQKNEKLVRVNSSCVRVQETVFKPTTNVGTIWITNTSKEIR